MKAVRLVIIACCVAVCCVSCGMTDDERRDELLNKLINDGLQHEESDNENSNESIFWELLNLQTSILNGGLEQVHAIRRGDSLKNHEEGLEELYGWYELIGAHEEGVFLRSAGGEYKKNGRSDKYLEMELAYCREVMLDMLIKLDKFGKESCRRVQGEFESEK